MPKTWGCMDFRDTFYNVGCRASPRDNEPVNASILPTKPESLIARARIAGQQHAARKTVISVGNSQKSPYLWGSRLVIYSTYAGKPAIFQRATWLWVTEAAGLPVSGVAGETSIEIIRWCFLIWKNVRFLSTDPGVHAHGGFEILTDMEICLSYWNNGVTTHSCGEDCS